VATYLDTIVATHRANDAVDGRSVADLVAEAEAATAPLRDFAAALTVHPAAGLAVIAEIKRRSPSRGDLAPGLDPRALAGTYEAGGAACLSVLTDAEFFGGSAEDLCAARAATQLPVLRKDFTVSVRDVADARLMGADAVLLIVAALSEVELDELHALAHRLGLAALVEVHDEAELERALECGARIVGVNQRDLTTFEVDHHRAVRLAASIPGDVVKVAESGVRDAADAAALRDVGYDAILVGEALVTSRDPASLIASFLEGH
jgi:indole-3-glycerol phosphate synthase